MLDRLIIAGDFNEWLDNFIDAENERAIYELWLAKVDNEDYTSFRERARAAAAPANGAQVEATITDSISILNSFNPEEGL